MKQITLHGGAVVTADITRQGKCRSCQSPIYWATTEKGKYMPIEEYAPNRYRSHFSSCPNADGHRESLANKVRESENNQERINNL
jgi:hypothetical protein